MDWIEENDKNLKRFLRSIINMNEQPFRLIGSPKWDWGCPRQLPKTLANVQKEILVVLPSLTKTVKKGELFILDSFFNLQNASEKKIV